MANKLNITSNIVANKVWVPDNNLCPEAVAIIQIKISHIPNKDCQKKVIEQFH